MEEIRYLEYDNLCQKTQELYDSLLKSPTRFQPIGAREDVSVVSQDSIKSSLPGRYLQAHRGLFMMKDSADLSIVQRLFWEVKPATIIELGTYSGANTLWMADMLKIMEIECSIYTVDKTAANMYQGIEKLCPPSVHFILGDANKIEESLPHSLMKSMHHPLVVIEDCHVNVRGTLDFFDRYMQSGDYFIVEDTNPFTPATSAMGIGLEEFKPFGPSKLDILKEFLQCKERCPLLRRLFLY